LDYRQFYCTLLIKACKLDMIICKMLVYYYRGCLLQLVKLKKLLKCRLAFTLVEILIILGIIGVVAGLTLPELIQRQQEIATVSRLKKVYSTLSQAYTIAVQENGTPENWNINNSITGPENILNILLKNADVRKNCGRYSRCIPDKYYQLFGSTTPNDYDNAIWVSKAQLADGTLIYTSLYGITNCGYSDGSTLSLQNICALIDIDINGFQKPNRVGIDNFSFWLTKYGIIPIGSTQESGYSFGAQCNNKTASSGMGCTAWVLYNENLDYLYCSNLSWNGKNKCS